MHPASAIVVKPPSGEPSNLVEAEKHIFYASTASSVAPVQDQACALVVVELATKPLPVMLHLHGLMGPCGSSQIMASRRIGPRVLKANLANTRMWTPSLGFWVWLRLPVGFCHLMLSFLLPRTHPNCIGCAPYHRFSDCVPKIRQEKLRAIGVVPKWTHREWWKPHIEITLQGYHLPWPETKARLYQDDHLTPLPQRCWSTVALYVDGGLAEENLMATKCHVASVLAPTVPNPDTGDQPGITSEEQSEDERVANHLVWVRTLTYQVTHKKLLAPVTLDPTPEDLEAQECVRSRIAKIEKRVIGRGSHYC